MFLWSHLLLSVAQTAAGVWWESVLVSWCLWPPPTAQVGEGFNRRVIPADGIQVSETQLTGSPNIHLSDPPVPDLSCGIWGLTGETGIGAVNKWWWIKATEWKSSCSVQRSLVNDHLTCQHALQAPPTFLHLNQHDGVKQFHIYWLVFQ